MPAFFCTVIAPHLKLAAFHPLAMYGQLFTINTINKLTKAGPALSNDHDGENNTQGDHVSPGVYVM